MSIKKRKLQNMNKEKITTDIKTIAKPYGVRCYYNDSICKGKVIRVNSFKKFLCEKCAEEDGGITDEVLDHDFNIGL